MMFNGLLVCGDSDTSDFTKESIGASSAAGSVISDQLSTSECFQSKLLATMQILENKEETIRVQAQSLALAEARITALTERGDFLRRQLKDMQSPRSPEHREIKNSDISIGADVFQETCHKKIVSALQDNLSVIEDLYRECFYETAKQEELIDLLRNSFLDVRIMEREKTEQIGHLQNVVNTQKWSLDRCQDIAIEVECLKSEISDFLNNSNHDSGMWEREESLAGELSGDLQLISGQLLQLSGLLASECTCGLRDENMKLREMNDSLETQAAGLHQRVHGLEAALEEKDRVNAQFLRQLEVKEQEVQRLSQQLAAVEETSMAQTAACDSLTRQVQQLQTLLMDRSAELLHAQQQCADREGKLCGLQEQFDQAQLVIEEDRCVRSEVSQLAEQVGSWREQLSASRERLRALQAELQRARAHCARASQQYREKAHCASELEGELEEAHRRGAELCGAVRRLVCGLPACLQRQRRRLREQEEKILAQEELIRRLHQCPDRRRISDNDPCCSRYIPRDDTRLNVSKEQIAGCSRCASLDRTGDRGSEIGRCSKCRLGGGRAEVGERTSVSESTGCSTPPKPPRRILRKKTPQLFKNDCDCAHCDVGVQRPVRSDAHASTAHACDAREVSPSDELLERVQCALHALRHAHRRWLGTRPRAHALSHSDTQTR